MQKKIFEKIGSYLDYAVELEKNLTAIPAIDPTCGGEGEYEKANYLESELKKLSFDKILRIDAPDKRVKSGVRPNIIAIYKGKNPGKKFWIMSHLDVVPPGDLKLWKTDPYKLHREGNKIYGRGSEDNQQGMVSSILAVKAMMDTGYRPPASIALFFNAEEEVSSKYGVVYVIDNKPELFGKNDIFLTPDGGNSAGDEVLIAEKAILWLKFTVTGKQCHASAPHKGINPVSASSKLICKLEKLYKKYPFKDNLFEPPISTFVPTKREIIETSVNTIPQKDAFYMDCRLNCNYKLDEVISSIKQIAEDVANETKTQIEVTVDSKEKAPPKTSLNSEITRLVIKAIKEVYATNAKPRGMMGASVARYTRNGGFPTVVYAKFDRTAHSPNEYSILDNLIGDAKVMALIAMNVKP